jgi:hypothetical protein
MEEKFVSIEEAVGRSLPVWGSVEMAKKEPGKYAVYSYMNPWYYPGFGKDSEVEGSLKLRVNMNDYLKVYEELISNPEKIKRYISLMPVEVLGMMEKDVNRYAKINAEVRSMKKGEETVERDKNIALIEILFGVTDHSGLYWRLDEGKSKELRDYFRKRVIEPDFIDLEDNLYKLKGVRPGGKVQMYLGFAKDDDSDNGQHFSGVEFASEFEMPRGNEEDIILFGGLKNMVMVLEESRLIREITFCPGDFCCFVPTWRE